VYGPTTTTFLYDDYNRLSFVGTATRVIGIGPPPPPPPHGGLFAPVSIAGASRPVVSALVRLPAMTRVIEHDIAAYAYDWSGARVRATRYTNGGTIVTYYTDGFEQREDASAPGQYATTVWVNAPGQGLIASITGGSTLTSQPTSGTAEADANSPWTGSTTNGMPPGTWYHVRSPFGSTSVVIDSTGNIVSRIAYEPYGRVDASHSVGFDTTTRKFQGREVDEETGLSYFGSRYYDPTVGRFASADTHTPGGGGSTLAYNRYAFAYDNPLAYQDPDGHAPDKYAPPPFWTAFGNALVDMFSPARPDFYAGSIATPTKTGSIALSRDDVVYKSVGSGTAQGVGVSGTIGWIVSSDRTQKVDAAARDSFLNGQGTAITICWTPFCLAVGNSPGTTLWSIEFGVGWGDEMKSKAFSDVTGGRSASVSDTFSRIDLNKGMDPPESDPAVAPSGDNDPGTVYGFVPSMPGPLPSPDPSSTQSPSPSPSWADLTYDPSMTAPAPVLDSSGSGAGSDDD
jgi:RHS repeat-associated protein